METVRAKIKNTEGKSTEYYATHLVVIVIAVACLFMAGPMRDGLPVQNGGSALERLSFIQANLATWQTGWLFWMMSALGLFYFCLSLRCKLSSSVSGHFAIGLVALGMAPDLMAEVIYAFIIPHLAISNEGLQLFQVLENMAVFMTGFLGNGLYNLGGLLLTLLLWRQKTLPFWVLALGLCAWILGLGLSVSVALASMSAAEWLTGLSMVMSTGWMLIIAHKVFK